MGRIVNVIPNDNYMLMIELDQGNKIFFNMRNLVNTMQYSKLKDLSYFNEVKFEDKAIYWSESGNERLIRPLRFTLDNILFIMRD